MEARLRVGASAAHRTCRASLARGNAVFLHAFWWKERDTDCRRAVLVFVGTADEKSPRSCRTSTIECAQLIALWWEPVAMAVYVPGCKHDIFVSYAHVDDEPAE